MGLGGISITQLSIVLLIVLLIFGTKRLRQAGGDIGGMFRGIREGFKEAAQVSEEIAPEVEELRRDVNTIRDKGRALVHTNQSDFYS